MIEESCQNIDNFKTLSGAGCSPPQPPSRTPMRMERMIKVKRVGLEAILEPLIRGHLVDVVSGVRLAGVSADKSVDRLRYCSSTPRRHAEVPSRIAEMNT